MTANRFPVLARAAGYEEVFSYLSRRDRDFLYSPVKDGHNELYRTCCILRTLGIDDEETAARIIAMRWSDYHRMPEDREFEDAWSASEDSFAEEGDREFIRKPQAKRDEDEIARILSTSRVTADVISRCSPVPAQQLAGTTAASFVRDLFPANALICLGQSASRASVSHIETAAAKARRHPLIVPSPMTSTKGKNKRGEWTTRCLDNTGPRLYAVTEFDRGTRDDQAKLIAEIQERHGDRLKMILWSGSKSLHAWWKVAGDETAADAIYDLAITIGADPATRVPCQFVRTPGALRDNGNTQNVIYYDANI